MTVYVDSSVLLRIVLRERGRLRTWPRITRAVSSELIRLECLRTIDRARLRFGLADSEVATQRAAVMQTLRGFELASISRVALERAADPYPTSLGTLDAIHLTTALLLRRRIPDLAVATHDEALALAARAVGLRLVA